MIKGNKHSYSRIYYNTTTKLIIHSSKNFQEFELCTFWEYNEQILPKKYAHLQNYFRWNGINKTSNDRISNWGPK